MDQEKEEKILLVFRGAPGAGKMTFVIKNDLQPYTECADTIRMNVNVAYRKPFFMGGRDGNEHDVIWPMFWGNMHKRAKKDNLIISCNTLTTLSEIKKHENFALEHGFKMYIVDFTNVSKTLCKKRNKMKYKCMRVSNELIDDHYERFICNPVPKHIDVITPEQAKEMVATFLKRGLN